MAFVNGVKVRLVPSFQEITFVKIKRSPNGESDPSYVSELIMRDSNTTCFHSICL
jgi:hypothetical protein